MVPSWLLPPSFSDNELTYQGRVVHAVMLCILILGPIEMLLQFALITGPGVLSRALAFGTVFVVAGAGTLAVNQLRPRAAGALTLLALFVIVTAAAATAGGTRAVPAFGYLLVLLVAAQVFGVRAALAMLAAIAATLLLMAYLEVEGLLPERQIVHTPYSAGNVLFFGLSIMMAALAVSTLSVRRFLKTLSDELTARRAAEVKLSTRVEQLEFLHQSAHLVSWIWDVAEKRIEWIGDRDALLGLPPGTFSGSYQDYLPYLHPDDREASQRNIRDCLSGVAPSYRVQERIVVPGRAVRWLEVVGQSERAADGRTIRMTGMLRDVTEQRMALEALAASERRYRGLFDSAQDGIAIMSPDGRISDINPASCSATGYSREELIGRSIIEFFPPEDLEAQPVRLDFHQHRRSAVSERRIKRKDGVVIPVEINRWQLPDGNIQANIRDLRERKQAEERFEKIFHVGPSAVTITRVADGTYLDVNRAWEQSSGYTREEAIGKTSTDLRIWPDPAHRARLVAALERDGAVHDMEVQARRKSGEITDLIVGAEFLELHGERYMVNSSVDVTARKRAEAEVLRMNATLEARVRDRTRELQESNRDLEGFSYSVSHDLRAPLRRILSFSQVLATSQDPAIADATRHALARIDHNARRMSALIDDLLAFAKLSKSPLGRRSVVDMHAEVAGLLEEFNLSGKVELGNIPTADCDPSMLRQVWQNLILNAVKFSSGVEQPTIEVRGARLPDGGSRYSIRDNGVGFDMAHASKLFGVFQRLHPDSQFEGTGVGLAIVHRIISRHNGEISVQSEPGKGAEFTFVLPAAENKVSE